MIEEFFVSMASTSIALLPISWIVKRALLAPKAHVWVYRAAIVSIPISLIPWDTRFSLTLHSGIQSASLLAWVPFMVWLLLLYGAGVFIVLSHTLRDHYRWFQDMKIQSEIDPALQERVESLCAKLRVAVPQLGWSPRLSGAVVVPGRRPMLVVGSEDFDDMILTHELIHLRNRDLSWLLFGRLIAAMFWFHPSVWAIESGLRLANEVRADFEAARGRNLYFAKLLLCYSGKNYPALGQAFGSDAKDLETRISALKCVPRTSFGSTCFLAASWLLLMAATLSIDEVEDAAIPVVQVYRLNTDVPDP